MRFIFFGKTLYNIPNWGQPIGANAWKINGKDQKIYPAEIIECPNYNLYVTREDSGSIIRSSWIGSTTTSSGDEVAGEEW